MKFVQLIVVCRVRGSISKHDRTGGAMGIQEPIVRGSLSFQSYISSVLDGFEREHCRFFSSLCKDNKILAVYVTRSQLCMHGRWL